MLRENMCRGELNAPCNRQTFVLILAVCAAFPRTVCAQPPPPDIVIAPEPVGSGARALGQSAFIAVADDATAASWNPAGLINLEKAEASFVGTCKVTTFDYSSTQSDVSIDEDSWSKWQLNFMSYARPIEVANTDVVLSVNYHQVYDFGLEFDYLYEEGDEALGVKGTSDGAVSAYSLAGAVSIPFHPEITLGASFNWYGQNLLGDYAWQVEHMAYSKDQDEPSFTWDLTRTETFDDFRGYNFTAGLLWDIYEKQETRLTLGFVCHTPFTAKVDREVVDRWPNAAPLPRAEHLDMDFPLSLGVGANYRFSDSFSIAFDADWKQWSQFEQQEPNGTWSKPIGDGKGDIDDTLAVRLGFERLWLSKPTTKSVFAWRSGVFYEPRPALDDPMSVYGFSLGLGWTVKERFSLDFAYQFRWGNEMGGRNLGRLPEFKAINYSTEEHLLVTSLITYF